ncbi:Acetyl-coenzyme A carboxylase carboxyl transferase subunit beta [Nymphon striatum]|nr:Acetyl-coenzyme A carboxylase carboxyl transferase subunit beta [Nymphon striatum]
MAHNIKPGVATGDEVQAIFNYAKEKGFALPAVNVIGSNTINGVLETAASLNAPVIIQILSEEPLEENIEICATYLKRMAKMDMTLEIELGITGGEEDGVDNSDVDDSKLYTQPEEVAYAYEELSKHNHIDFVFHGGSGSTVEEIREGISYGVIKMNIDTDLQYAFLAGVRDYVQEKKDYLQSQIGNPTGADEPNKKNYDPRVWLREGEKTFVERLKKAFEDLNNAVKNILKSSLTIISLQKLDAKLTSKDPLKFEDTKKYKERLVAAQKKTGLKDAVRTGFGKSLGKDVVISCMDFNFIGGSMGSVVGEKIARGIDHAIKKKVPFVMISKSGGARMMEAALSLMQLAKTSAKLAQLAEAKLPYISLCTDPTTGGTTASYAMLGDINIAEPGALIGFAGP